MKDHLKYLGEVYQLSHNSLDRYWFYIRHLLLWAGETHLGQAAKIRPSLAAYIAGRQGKRQGHPLAAETRKKIIETARRFFVWARSVHPSEFRDLPMEWIEVLRPPRVVGNLDEHVYVSFEEAIQLATHPIEEENIALRRDQAAAAFLFLSGMRATAFTTLPIQAVNVNDRSIHQWPELGVKTKNTKKATTFLLPIPDLLDVVLRWDALVRATLSSSAPWYVPVKSQWGEHSLSLDAPGDHRNQALNKRLRILFRAAGLPYKSAHKFRHGHAVYGLQHARTVADYKAVSMNLMHEDIKITDQIYAPILTDEVSKRIAGLSGQPVAQPDDDLLAFFRNLNNAQLSMAMLIAAERLSQ